MSSRDEPGKTPDSSAPEPSSPENAARRRRRRKGTERKELDPPPHLIEAFCKTMSRLEQGKRLYAPENRLLQLMIERLEDAWRLLQARGKPFHLDILPEGIKYHKLLVFKQSERNAFSDKLYQDGLRRVSFSPRADILDILEFLSVFDPNDARWQHEADCADKLWILDQRWIRFQAVDGFDELIKQTRGKAQEQYAAALSQFAGNAGSLKRVSDELTEYEVKGEKQTQEESAIKDWGETRRVEVSINDMRYLHEEVDDKLLEKPESLWSSALDSPEHTFAHFHELLWHVASSHRSPIDHTELQEMLQRLFFEQLAHDGAGMTERIESSFDAPPPLGDLAREAWQDVVEQGQLSDLITASEPGSPRQNSLIYLLNRYVNPSPESLADSVVRSKNPEGIDPLMDMLYGFEGDHLELWLERFEDLSPRIIEKIFARTTEAEMRTATGWDFLDKVWAYPLLEDLGEDETDPGIKVLVMGMTLSPLDYLGDAVETLKDWLTHAAPEVRKGANQGLRILKDPATGIYVLNLIRKSRERGYEDSDIRELLHTLMIVGGERYVPFLEQCMGPLSKRSQGMFKGSFRANYTNPVGDFLILQALVRHGSPKAMDIIKAVYNHPNAQDLKSYIGALRVNPEALPDEIEKAKAEVARAAGEELPNPSLARSRPSRRNSDAPLGLMGTAAAPSDPAAQLRKEKTDSPPSSRSQSARRGQDEDKSGPQTRKKRTLLDGLKGFMKRD